MTDAQTWTALGGFLAVFAAMSGLLLRVVGRQIRGVQALSRRVFGVDDGHAQ
jgi:hypothetical protein